MLTSNQILNDTYQVIREIGKGGTGTVYLAYHRRLEKYVVLKKLQNLNPYQDWRKEVDILKLLRHTNLPQVYDYLEGEDAVYTVMDYVEGDSLASYLKAGYHFEEESVRTWLGQLADVIAYLHSHKPPILHCDIKPENVMITPNGDAVLIDFNVAMAARYDNLVGISPAYASPEQMDMAQEIAMGYAPSFELDGRSDIYSIAATFYSVLSGKMPSAFQRMTPLKEMNLDYSEALIELLDKAMDFDRDKRPQDAKRFYEAVLRLRRRESGLRTVFALRVASLVLCGLMIAGGVYCLLVSRKAKIAETYAAELSSVVSELQITDSAQMEQRCWQILNEPAYQSLLAEHPSDKARLYAALGDLDYAENRLRSAADFYQQAAQTAPRGEQSGYWRSAVICLAESGELNAAQSLREQAAAEMSEADTGYVAAILYAKQGEEAECIAQVNALLQTEAEPILCAKACIAAASVCSTTESKLAWLTRANQYGGGKTATRALAAAYVDMAQNGSENAAWQAKQNALDLYKSLADDLYATRADRLNYAIVLRMVGQPVQAQRVLEQLLAEWPEDYRILAQMAFSCYEAKMPEQAREYCAKALRAWNADLSPEREDAESQTVRNLRALEERLN